MEPAQVRCASKRQKPFVLVLSSVFVPICGGFHRYGQLLLGCFTRTFCSEHQQHAVMPPKKRPAEAGASKESATETRVSKVAKKDTASTKSAKSAPSASPKEKGKPAKKLPKVCLFTFPTYRVLCQGLMAARVLISRNE